jgi:hypothetical protein
MKGDSVTPETRFATTPDDIYLAYQAVGSGPVDVVMDFHAYAGNVDLIWDEPDWGSLLIQRRPIRIARPDSSGTTRVHDWHGLRTIRGGSGPTRSTPRLPRRGTGERQSRHASRRRTARPSAWASRMTSVTR